MVQGIDGDFRGSPEFFQLTAGKYGNAVGGVGTGCLLAVLEGSARLYLNILINTAACGDVHDLHAPANAEKRQIPLHGFFAEGKFIFVPQGRNLSILANGFFPKAQGVNISAASKEDAVHKVREFLSREQQHRNAAGFQQRIGIVFTDFESCFFIGIVRRNADNGFFHHVTPFLCSFTVYKRRACFATDRSIRKTCQKKAKKSQRDERGVLELCRKYMV